MTKNTVLLVAEDNEGQFTLLKKNFERCGIGNDVIRFKDGQEAVDFFFAADGGRKHLERKPYILMADVRLPKVDGVELLKRIKQDKMLRKMPVIMLSNSDNSNDIDICHDLGCSIYLVKSADYEQFVDMVRKVGLFLSGVEVPDIDGAE